ncbi:cardiolipin synthase [Methanimicrococcus blatticola]|uniref:Cardiolipin synthetase 2 n=1 Tax=Methanimicrococcus blatticola TaxID=91560 RepID=A0A484F597_9EURY|nr:cardiolipin synthase [Methanimicrococcus blatticola]MBZ3936281.1 cardiolipin synthase [Methanimicrococcus blatticola]MCC2508284.1 cardiolipin synthase [Methanimicrococcus blatticola]TDQ70261.1 cardiolipin synthetase 2 [Methanimicrococcus blatticola]
MDWTFLQELYVIFLIAVVIVNTLAMLTIVFYERRSPQVAAAWILLLVFVPVLGFFVYIFFGRHLYGKYKYGKKTVADHKFEKYSNTQIESIQTKEMVLSNAGKNFESTVNLLLKQDHATYFDNNDVDVYISGAEKFAAIKEAIWSANESIHMEYYIIRDDPLGREIMDLLAQKAAQGVEVRVLFDAVGVHKVRPSFYKKLKQAGGDVRILFPLTIPFLNTRINYRNHRKILVVDGRVGFIGGFNIGVEHLGEGPLGYWRDTHLRIKGGSVSSLQRRFIMDWNYAAKEKGITNETIYYPMEIYDNRIGDVAVQIASSGPDTDGTAIYSGFLSLVGHAKKSIYIQTPYFIPDQSVFEALRVACLSGIDVRIEIPCKPDHPFVYWASYSYLGDLIRLGAKGYTYDRGFIHSKTAVFDGEVATIGTANWDIRSFKLNFETNAFIYDTDFGEKMNQIILDELETDCKQITVEDYNNRPFSTRVKEGFSRLISPLL